MRREVPVRARLAAAALVLVLLLTGGGCVWAIRAGREALAVGLGLAALSTFLAVWLTALHAGLGPRA